jgi:hypothetical protein
MGLNEKCLVGCSRISHSGGDQLASYTASARSAPRRLTPPVYRWSQLGVAQVSGRSLKIVRIGIQTRAGSMTRGVHTVGCYFSLCGE